MLKHINRELIINTAFEEWGKTCFKNMSLTRITDKLKITKPALYRYFKNKKELLNTMREILFDKLLEISNSFINESKIIPKKEIILLFIKRYFEFFGHNLYYFLFYIFYAIKENYFDNKDVIKVNNQLSDIISIYLKNNVSRVTHNESDNLMRYIFSTGIFFTVFAIHNEIECNKVTKELSNSEINKNIESIYQLVMSGIKCTKLNKNINFNEIEKNSFLRDIKFERNKIFDSIADVIAKNGFWQTSIKKISDNLGVSKSNLYQHFKNKKEMISDMIIKELKQKDILIKEKICNYSDFFEKLYCAIVALSTYFLNDYRTILVFDWFHYQGFDLKKVHNTDTHSNPLYLILKEGIEKKMIKTYLNNIELLTGYLNMQIIKEILLLKLMNKQFDLNHIRFLFKMFLNGIAKENK